MLRLGILGGESGFGKELAGDLLGLLQLFEDVGMGVVTSAGGGTVDSFYAGFFICKYRAHLVPGLVLDLVEFLQPEEHLLDRFWLARAVWRYILRVVIAGFLHFRI